MTRSHDPVEAETGKLLLDSYRQARQADHRQGEPSEDLPRTRWAHALNSLVGDLDERHWVTADEFKTGHSQQHASRSGSCLSVNLAKGLWYCSSCRLGGDSMRWVEIHGIVDEADPDGSVNRAYVALRKLFGQPYAD